MKPKRRIEKREPEISKGIWKIGPDSFGDSITLYRKLSENHWVGVGSIELRDLKDLRKVVRKAIKDYEDNQRIQI